MLKIRKKNPILLDIVKEIGDPMHYLKGSCLYFYISFKNIGRTTYSLLVMRSYLIIFSLQMLCTRFLRNNRTDVGFIDAETQCDFYILLYFCCCHFCSCLTVDFVIFLWHVLCKADLRHYQRYDYKIYTTDRYSV